MLSIYAQAMPTREQIKYDKINQALYIEEFKRMGLKTFSADTMMPLKNADQYEEVTISVANESIVVHEHMGSFDYKYDVKVVGKMKDGTEDILMDIQNYQFEIVKDEKNELKIIKWTEVKDEKGGNY